MSTQCAGEMGGTSYQWSRYSVDTALHVFTHWACVCTGVYVYTCVYDNTLDP